MVKKKSKSNWTAAMRFLQQELSREQYGILKAARLTETEQKEGEPKGKVREFVVTMYDNYRKKLITKEKYVELIKNVIIFAQVNENRKRRMRYSIVDHGYSIVTVAAHPPERPAYSYTVGLINRLGMDLIVIGDIPHEVRHDVLDRLARISLTLEEVKLNTVFDNLFDDTAEEGVKYRVKVIEISPLIAIQYWADQVVEYMEPGQSVRMAQVMLPDREGNLPDELGYNREFYQPILVDHFEGNKYLRTPALS